MYNLEFYRDQNGHAPVLEYLQQYEKDSGKDSRINLRKIRSYMMILTEKGTYAGEPYIKHLEGPIWELRPLRNRILFAAWRGDGFILLHAFLKTTQRTPRREIERALREYRDIQEAENNEQQS